MILTRQTCSLRPSRAAGSKRQALENYFYERICHMFLMSRRLRSKAVHFLGTCSTCIKRTAAQCQILIFFCGRNTFFFGSRHAQQFSLCKYPNQMICCLYHKICNEQAQNKGLKTGGRQPKDCSQTRSFSFQFRLGKHFSDERGLPFYYLKIGFLEYLQISGEIRYPNGPIGN